MLRSNVSKILCLNLSTRLDILIDTDPGVASANGLLAAKSGVSVELL